MAVNGLLRRRDRGADEQRRNALGGCPPRKTYTATESGVPRDTVCGGGRNSSANGGFCAAAIRPYKRFPCGAAPPGQGLRLSTVHQNWTPSYLRRCVPNLIVMPPLATPDPCGWQLRHEGGAPTHRSAARWSDDARGKSPPPPHVRSLRAPRPDMTGGSDDWGLGPGFDRLPVAVAIWAGRTIRRARSVQREGGLARCVVLHSPFCTMNETNSARNGPGGSC